MNTEPEQAKPAASTRDSMGGMVIHRMLIDESFRIEHSQENGFDYIADQRGLASRERVEALMVACQSHLDHLSSENIEIILNEWRDEVRNSSRSSQPLDAQVGQKPSAIGFVYLMRNMRNGLTKIGFSKNPQFREKTLQSEEPEVEMEHSWPGTMSDEEAIHIHFDSKRVRGEWFRLTTEDRKAIRRKMSRRDV